MTTIGKATFREVVRPATTQTPGEFTSTYLLPDATPIVITDNLDGTWTITCGSSAPENFPNRDLASVYVRQQHHEALVRRNAGVPERVAAVIAGAGPSLYQFNDPNSYEEIGGGEIRLLDLSGNGRTLESTGAPLVGDDPTLGPVVALTGSEWLTATAPASDYNLLHNTDSEGHIITISGGFGTVASTARANGDNGFRALVGGGGANTQTLVYSDLLPTQAAAFSGIQAVSGSTALMLSSAVADNAPSGAEFTGLNSAGDEYQAFSNPTQLSNGDTTYDLQVGRLANGGDGFQGGISAVIILKDPTPAQVTAVRNAVSYYYLGFSSGVWDDNGVWDDSGIWGN